jgi:hypothetical protein
MGYLIIISSHKHKFNSQILTAGWILLRNYLYISNKSIYLEIRWVQDINNLLAIIIN